MAASAYGGIRGGGRVSAAFGLGPPPDNGPAGAPGASPAMVGPPSRPAGMATRGPLAVGPDTAPVLIALVFAEVAALVFMRYAFRHYHGG